MRNIGLLVGRELGAYLRTPAGYLIGAAFLLLNGILFNALAVTSEPRLSSEVLITFLRNAGGVTEFAAVLLSMRLLAEDRSTGTQVLLFTSPVREQEIVLGKYLAAVIVLSLLVLLSLYLPALIFINGKVSWGHIFAGYIGLLMLGATTLAVGTFASSLASHPFLAVLLTTVFVALLELSWWVGQLTEPPLSDVLAYFAPFWKHFQPFAQGLFQLSGVVFYASLIYLSLLGATRVLQSQRWR
ncbi:MAG: ABC transporter permease [Sandaracinaceae bacterium]